MTDSFTRNGVQFKILRRGDWDPLDHPRDRKGRFIEVGARVSIWGGATGRVLRNVGNGRIEIERDTDGKHVVVHRNYLTVTARPDGSDPTDDAAEALPAPVQEPSAHAEQVNDDGDVDIPNAKPGILDFMSNDTIALAVEETPADAFDFDGAATVADAAGAPDADPEPEGDGDVVPMETTYTMRRWEEAVAINSIEIANRRAERAGISERFTYTIEHFEKRKANPLGGPEQIIEMSRLTLNRPSVEHDGWKFVATLSWDPEAGLVTRGVPGETLLHRPEARKCDVCKSNRDRRDTYVVRNGDQELQVGSNCLTQFMGIRPAGLWMLGFDPEIPNDDDDDGGRERRDPDGGRWDSLGVLALGWAIVQDRGWVSRSAAGVARKPATADLVTEVLTGFPKPRGRNHEIEAELRWRDGMRAQAAGFAEEAQAVLDTARTMEGDSDYVANLRAVAAPDNVSGRNMALLLSGIAAKIARQERAAREAAQPESESEWIGKPKDKIKDVPARVLGVRYIDGDYGTTTLYTLMTDDGNVVKWFASGRREDAAVDDTVLVGGTIKGHGEFRGVKETTLTRAKITRDAASQKRQDEREEAARKAYEEEHAEEIAARRAAEAEMEARREPKPEGYLPWSAFTPVGTMLRVRRGIENQPYKPAYLVAGPFKDENGEDRVVVHFPNEDYSRTINYPASNVGSIAPVSEQNLAEGAAIAAREIETLDVLPGQRRVEYRERATIAGALSPGMPVRVYFGGKYHNATVVSVEGGSIEVRVDGEVRTIGTEGLVGVAVDLPDTSPA